MSSSDDYFSSRHLRTDLKGKTVRGGLFTALAQAVMLLTSLLAIPALTRLLEPADFGLVAMVTVFIGLGVMLADAGLAMATVQRDQISEQQVSNLFWIAAVLGLLIALLICVSSPIIAWFYDEPRLIPITVALSAAPFFSGLTVQHQALLRRTMQLRRLAVVQVASHVIGQALAIVAAWHYRSYWALVTLPVSVAALRMIGTLAACGWRPSRPRRNSGVRAMVGFGANLTGFNFINYFARSGDNVLIGWSWGETALGFYERAYKLMMTPLQQISAPLAGVMIPALSRLVSEPQTYRAAYSRVMAVFQVISCPLMVFIAITAPSVIRVVFGPGYDEAVPILRWLAVAGFIQPLTNSLGWLYISQGRGRELMRWGVLSCSLIMLSFVLGLPHGPSGVARAYAVMFCLVVAPLAMWFAGSTGPVTRGELGKSCGVAIIMAIPTATASVLVVHVLGSRSAPLQLVCAVFGSAVATALLLLCTRFGRSLLSEFKKIRELVFAGAAGAERLPPSKGLSVGNGD